MNKIAIIISLFLILGCRSKSKLYEKELIGAQIEKMGQVETNLESRTKKDSVIQKKKVEEKVNQSTNIKVEFDPKINDSLEVKYQLGKDSLLLKIKGNGKVTLDYITDKTQTKTETKELFGSQTLYNLDSVAKSKEVAKAEIISEKQTKQVEEKGFSFPIYLIIGGAVFFIILLWFLWNKFGGNIIERLKNNR